MPFIATGGSLVMYRRLTIASGRREFCSIDVARMLNSRRHTGVNWRDAHLGSGGRIAYVSAVKRRPEGHIEWICRERAQPLGLRDLCLDIDAQFNGLLTWGLAEQD